MAPPNTGKGMPPGAGAAMLLILLGMTLTAVTVYSGYRAKVTALRTGWGNSTWLTYLFSSDYKGEHRIALIIGCYVLPVIAIACFAIAVRLSMRKRT